MLDCDLKLGMTQNVRRLAKLLNENTTTAPQDLADAFAAVVLLAEFAGWSAMSMVTVVSAAQPIAERLVDRNAEYGEDDH